ncbi:recombinase family protein [Mycolicibacterium sp. Y3]
MTRVAVYARISLDARDTEAGVDRQLEACRALAEKLGAHQVTEYVDNSISAYSGAVRPEFERLLIDLAGGRHDTLVCWHVDRLYRSLSDLERIIDAVGSVGVATVNSGQLDLSTSAGRMIARILGSVSRQESEHHAERRRAANHERRLAGAWRKEGSRPFGFNGDGTHREPEATMVRQAVQDILAGTSIHEIARRWNASGVTTVRGAAWSNLHVRRVLSNARLAALVVHNGDVIGPGTWEPIVDETLWRGLQALMSDPARQSALSWKRVHLLSGIALCGVCTKPLYGRWAHGRSRPPTYACRESHVARSVPALDKFVTKFTLKYLTRQGLAEDLRGEDADTTELEIRRKALLTTKASLAGLLRKGILTADDVERDALQIQAELDEIGLALAGNVTVHPAVQLLDADEDDTRTIHDRWDAASLEIKAAVIAASVTITVYPAPHGQRKFDPKLIDIKRKNP